MLQEVNAIFQTFGASVVVPIIIFIIALLLRVIFVTPKHKGNEDKNNSL